VKHDIVDNDNFFSIWELRECFVPAYFQDRFIPFLQTTARIEGFNAVLKRYVNPHDSLLRFFQQYMKLQEDIEIHEDAHEFAGEDKIVRLWLISQWRNRFLKDIQCHCTTVSIWSHTKSHHTMPVTMAEVSLRFFQCRVMWLVWMKDLHSKRGFRK
jgi:hypothetical protein